LIYAGFREYRFEMPDKPRTTYLLRQCYAAVHERLRARTNAYGLAPGEYKALSVIAERASCSSADLARTSEVTPQAINQLVIALERREMIRRSAQEGNRRIALITLTETGRAALAGCDRSAEALDDELFGGLGKSELAELRATLLKTLRIAIEPKATSGLARHAPNRGPGESRKRQAPLLTRQTHSARKKQ
jgi:DNA-binding MarR family transcriptional regulator